MEQRVGVRDRVPTWLEEIHRKHAEHMERVHQRQWLEDLLVRVYEPVMKMRPDKKRG